MEGRGVLRTNFGILYDGGFHESQFTGLGILETPQGVYEGEFDQGFRNGQGSMKYNDSSVYDGAWKDDMWHGFGRWSSPHGVYEGDFLRGRREGQGKMEYSTRKKSQQLQTTEEASFYDGAWKDDRPHGVGTFICPNAYECKYEGEWEYGRRSGKGVLWFSNGAKWEGNFEKNKPTGNGKMTYTDDLILTGKWKAGQRELKCLVSMLDVKAGGSPSGTPVLPGSNAPTSPTSSGAQTTTDSNGSGNASVAISVDEEKGVEESGYAEYLPPPQFPFINTSHFLDTHW